MHFELRQDPASSDETFSFIQVTDIHLSLRDRAVASDLVEDLERLNRDGGNAARFVAVTGDLTNRGTADEVAAYCDAVKTSRLPVYHCMGNHDDPNRDGLGIHYMDALGPTYYSFDYGPVHFVVYYGVRQRRFEGDLQPV